MNLDILIIYQDDDLCGTLSRFLLAEGHTAACIPGEIESVTKALQLRPDLIIIDITLSELSAKEIISHLGSWRSPAGNHIPVIVISGFPLLEFELPHISDFICKPLNLERVRESIETVAAGRSKKGARTIDATLSPEEHDKFRDYLIKHSGLNFDRHNIKILERGLGRRMATLRIASCSEYYHYLTRKTGCRHELQKLLQLLTVGESFFFRQQGHFTSLMETVLPEIMKRGGNNRIRLLSAGCSSGEEPYSMAMSVMEAVPDWKRHDIRILGADINNHSLMRALEGGYSSWKIRGTGKRFLDKYFHRIGESHVVNDDVKTLVDFAHLDLCTVHSSSHQLMAESFDVIFCRNVLIYFPLETIKSVVASFAEALKPGGYLFLGYSETLAHFSSRFERLIENGVVYYRKRDVQRPSIEKTEPALSLAGNKDALRIPLQLPPAPAPCSLQDGKNIDLLYKEALARKHERAYASAENLFRQVLDRKADHIETIVGEAMILASCGRFHESLQRCDRVLQIDDLLPEAYYVRGFAYDRTGRSSEAIDEYRKAILLKMDFIMPHYRLGILYSRSGQHGNGKRSLKNSLKLLEQVEPNGIIPFSGGATRELFIEQIRHEISMIDAALAVKGS